MGLYKYRFESILKYRKSIENNKKNLLSLSIKKFYREKRELEKLNQNLNESYESMKKEFNDGVTIEKLVKMTNHQNFYKEGIKKKNIDVENAENSVKERRQELIKAVQDKKIIEKLKEMDLNNFKYEEQRKDEKKLDEIISFKHSSK